MGEEGSEVGPEEAGGCRDVPALAPACAAADTVPPPLPVVGCRVDGAAPAFSVPADACADGEQECKEAIRAAAGQPSLPVVGAEVFEAVPAFKRLNLTHGELNDTIAKLNHYLSQKRHSEDARSAGVSRGLARPWALSCRLPACLLPARPQPDRLPLHADTVSISEMQEHLGLGAKSKTFVLLLTHLSMLKTVKIDGHIVYAISSVPAA